MIIVREKKIDYPRIVPDCAVVLRLLRYVDGYGHCMGHQIEGWLKHDNGTRVPFKHPKSGKMVTSIKTVMLTEKKAKANVRFNKMLTCREPVHPMDLVDLTENLVPTGELRRKLANCPESGLQEVLRERIRIRGRSRR